MTSIYLNLFNIVSDIDRQLFSHSCSSLARENKICCFSALKSAFSVARRLGYLNRFFGLRNFQVKCQLHGNYPFFDYFFRPGRVFIHFSHVAVLLKLTVLKCTIINSIGYRMSQCYHNYQLSEKSNLNIFKRDISRFTSGT